jgi:hypothetical protein
VERLLALCQQGAQMQQQAEQAATQLKDMYYELAAQVREAQQVCACSARECHWRSSGVELNQQW